MQRAMQRELGLAKLPEPPDVADALAVALCHYHLRTSRRRIGGRRGAGESDALTAN